MLKWRCFHFCFHCLRRQWWFKRNVSLRWNWDSINSMCYLSKIGQACICFLSSRTRPDCGHPNCNNHPDKPPLSGQTRLSMDVHRSLDGRGRLFLRGWISEAGYRGWRVNCLDRPDGSSCQSFIWGKFRLHIRQRSKMQAVHHLEIRDLPDTANSLVWEPNMSHIR